MPLFYAYQNRFSDQLWIKLQDDHRDIADALTSPSVVWLCRGIEADTLEEATNLAKQRKAHGEGEVTFGGHALKPQGTDRERGITRPRYTGD